MTVATSPISVQDPQAAGRGASASVRWWRIAEHGADRVFGERDNPLRQLGALGFFLFWLVTASGAYLYVFFDTSLAGAYASVESLTREQWWAGGLMRSLHRYASDAMVAVVALHTLRELALGRFSGFRWFSWVTGVPTLWLLGASGVVGYWLVWDEVAQFVGIATTEWFGAVPGFGPMLVRNFVGPEAMTDRMFSLLVFLHIGVPLLLLLAMWAHIQRITRARTTTSRALGWWTLAALLLVSILWPARSQAPADLSSVPALLPVDWFYLAPFPAIYAASPAAVWAVAIAGTLLLFAAPWLARRVRPAPAKVDPAHCNGCTRCFADCPYAAITMRPHPDGRGQVACVDEDLCAACGICAGSCPSSTPFRSAVRLDTGIDLPWLPLDALRSRIPGAVAAARDLPQGASPIVVFSCAKAAAPPPSPDVVRLDLACAGMLPPSFVEFALREGASGVMVASCSDDDCEYRLGARWIAQRLDGRREPRLREAVDRERVRLVHCARETPGELAAATDSFRAALRRLGPVEASASGALHAREGRGA